MEEPIFECANVPVAGAAKALGVDCQTVHLLIQNGVVDWGTPNSRYYSYLLSPRKFFEAPGTFTGGCRL